jgi:hypothetical protein
MHATNDNDLFDPKDFESIKILIVFRNLTTDQNLLEKDFDKVSIVEFGDRSISVSLPDYLCGMDNHMLFTVYRVEREQPPHEVFQSTAKIIELQETDQKKILRAALSLIQFDTKSWEEFQQLFMKRQKEIEAFFENGKK